MYKCEECKKVFNVKSNLTRHQKNVHSKLFKCKHCNAKFVNEQEKKEHENNKHAYLHCDICNKYQTRYEKHLKKHYETKHRPSYKRKQEDNEDIPQKKIKYDEEIQAPPPAPL